MKISLPSPKKIITSKAADVFFRITLTFVWGFFAYRHVEIFLKTREVAYILFCALETLQAFFFLTRSQARSFSTDPAEWGVAAGATFLPLFFRATDVALWRGAFSLVTATVIYEFFALASLNRSFGIVPAIRKMKTSGLYRFVRHPMYAGYVFSFSGYFLSNFSYMNLLILVSTMILMIVRLSFEEAFLMRDQDYQVYAKKVRWRLLPGIY
jgi:protein-S-isoprenylcysteine O-methyltransferase Ste14